MLKLIFCSAVVCLAPFFLCAAPASVYGKALQRARNVSSRAEQSRALPPEKTVSRPVPPPSAPAVDRLALAGEFSRAVSKAKLKRYPVSGAAGVARLIERKIVPPRILGKDLRLPLTEKALPVAWFGNEANRAGKEVFPLFVTKPAFGPVIVGFTDGRVVQLKQSPRSVTGVINILRSTAPNKKSPLWNNYQRAAGSIDRSSK